MNKKLIALFLIAGCGIITLPAQNKFQMADVISRALSQSPHSSRPKQERRHAIGNTVISEPITIRS
jgi:hypothetical protein